jgi:dTDP-glucose 4,6-dehydratase
LIRFEPASLVMLDRDDTLLAEVQLSLEGRALLENPNLVLADIRDAERVEQVFEMHQPEVVFHAAALKHLTLLERFPREAWTTNVLGTVNVLQAAQKVGVKNFVNISTDKAADPTSVLGSSKRITERITADVAEKTGERYVSVRFGNVLGSRGSVLTIFKKQVEQGGPITVTDPGVTRYFMTVSEATRLTAFAGAIGRAGEVLVLDMGAPIRIADVARRFARQYSPELQVVYTGLRAGEKMHESLFAEYEEDLRPFHPLVSHVPVEPLAISSLELECRGINESADVSNQLISLANS